MSVFLDRVRELVRAGEVRISEHGYDELSDDGLSARELLAGVAEAVVVEEYPNYPKGPCVLLLQRDFLGKPVHAVWGVPRGHDSKGTIDHTCRFREVVMATAKERMLRIIDAQPEDSSYEEILRELAFARMVEQGLKDSNAGKTISDEEMQNRIRSWRS